MKRCKELIIVGGGGHARSLIDVIEQEGRFKIGGIVDNGLPKGETVLGYKVLGNDVDLKYLRESFEYAVVGIGQIRNIQKRKEIFNNLKKLEFQLPIIISPRAYISRYAIIEEGTVVMHDALINVNARVGRNCIINSKALIEHDAVIEDFSHIATGAIVNGGAVVKAKTFIGSGAVVKEYSEVSGFIKAGSVVK